tara:strand:+ start:250 stop:543 length:294 start_codon:yes stop_codon:yes gene_type:complete
MKTKPKTSINKIRRQVKALEIDVEVIKSYLRSENAVKINAIMNLLERYIEFKGDMKKFIDQLEEDNNEVSKKKGKKKQAKRSRASKTSSKDSKGLQT